MKYVVTVATENPITVWGSTQQELAVKKGESPWVVEERLLTATVLDTYSLRAWSDKKWPGDVVIEFWAVGAIAQ